MAAAERLIEMMPMRDQQQNAHCQREKCTGGHDPELGPENNGNGMTRDELAFTAGPSHALRGPDEVKDAGCAQREAGAGGNQHGDPIAHKPLRFTPRCVYGKRSFA